MTLAEVNQANEALPWAQKLQPILPWVYWVAVLEEVFELKPDQINLLFSQLHRPHNNAKVKKLRPVG